MKFAVAHTGPFFSYFFIKYNFLFVVFLGGIRETGRTVAYCCVDRKSGSIFRYVSKFLFRLPKRSLYTLPFE